MAKKVLVVEDEFVIAHDLRNILKNLGYEVVGIALSEAKAIPFLEQDQPDMVLLDIQLKGERTGIDIAHMLNERYQIPFVFVTSFSDEHTVTMAKETNPFGYVLKPFKKEQIYAALEIGLARAENLSLQKQNAYLSEEISSRYRFESVIGESEGMRYVFQVVERVAPTDTTILVTGETGTGKELIARAIHDHSPRRSHPMIKVNCAALPLELIESELFGHERGAFTGASQKRIGKLELAHQSTIFLDEIGELPLASQAKLLRFLQEKEVEPLGSNRVRLVDVRIVAATNRNLDEEVAAGRFRADLYFRLNVLPLRIPPLRERNDDILTLAKHFLQKINKKLGRPSLMLSPTALQRLTSYHWPGNVRELEHTIERAILLSTGPTLEIPPLQEEAPAATSAPFVPISLQEWERRCISATLRYCQGRVRGKGGAAELLEMHPSTLDARIRKLGITKKMVIE